MIQWFPGHMAKAIRQFEENIHLVDIVFELVDARCPYSSINPEVARISQDKPRLMILTKSDLANPNITNQWLSYFRAQGYAAIAIDSKKNTTGKYITKVVKELLADKIDEAQKKGFDKKIIRAICVGVPNVGKSTLLNQIVKRRAAQVGNRAGVTKGQQWLRSSDELELLDTPGILWPKFQNDEIANKLALSGAIKDSIYHSDDVGLFALHFFREFNGEELMNRYHLSEDDMDLSDVDLLLKITEKLGMHDDYERASMRIILDARKGKIGRFTLDAVSDLDNEEVE
ncbi:MAG: ribosome biogenesis GTPase YlqF [Apilactobacillus sp.]|uniref:ribosome biogenesis GTPase YlqF n=1 Tax=Apilactobacillus TaxID=2767877 RepID=UPI0025CEEAD8|nr:ribosome biogenesis GTPase YlqF [Apilactobacillus sp.]MCT6822400.1 ribosome biogenesis GTPase YlqF [Apilactobacillus sp.]MCT6858618.1 ribosome biogenesis GTPase YlqF [Apilactobacillus sp.]